MRFGLDRRIVGSGRSRVVLLRRVLRIFDVGRLSAGLYRRISRRSIVASEASAAA